MHAEDYVHRIGRTGRAHAVGDAISFVTPDDHGELRSLERFIGRGIVRKRAEGFNYAAAGPVEEPRSAERHMQRPRAVPHSLPGIRQRADHNRAGIIASAVKTAISGHGKQPRY
jgi:ATP-dependent RNA helicase RhlE